MWLIEALITANNWVKAAVGTISEQTGSKIPGQYLPGGASQAVIEFPLDTKAQLKQLGERVMQEGKPVAWIDPATGIQFTIRPTGWTDANGVYGYVYMLGQAIMVQTLRLEAREIVTKENREVTP